MVVWLEEELEEFIQLGFHDYVVLKVEFWYSPLGGGRYLPTLLKYYLYGGSKRIKPVHERVNELMGSEVLIPLTISFVKNPRKEGRHFMGTSAHGYIIVYMTTVVDKDEYEKMIKYFKEVLEPILSRLGVKRYELYIAYRIEEKEPTPTTKERDESRIKHKVALPS
jgi:hypothetical protein